MGACCLSCAEQGGCHFPPSTGALRRHSAFHTGLNHHCDKCQCSLPHPQCILLNTRTAENNDVGDTHTPLPECGRTFWESVPRAVLGEGQGRAPSSWFYGDSFTEGSCRVAPHSQACFLLCNGSFPLSSCFSLLSAILSSKGNSCSTKWGGRRRRRKMHSLHFLIRPPSFPTK